MESQLDIFDPVARVTDPDTSWAAARSVTDLTQKQAAVLSVLRSVDEGMTDEQIARQYDCGWSRRVPQSPSGLRTRRKELVDLGLVRDSGRRAEMETGRMAIVWEVA